MSAAAVTRPPTLPTNASALNHPYRRHTSDFESSSKKHFHVAKKKALTAADTAYMTACKTRRQTIDCKSERTGAWYQRGAESVIGGVERGKRLAELRKAQFAKKLPGGVVAAHDGNSCEAGECCVFFCQGANCSSLATLWHNTSAVLLLFLSIFW